MKHFLLALPAALALTACVESHTHHHHHQGGMVPPGSQGAGDMLRDSGGRFGCQNGLYVNIDYLDADRLQITMDDKFATLQSAPSASGTLYSSNAGLFGNMTQWHQKGNEGVLAFVDPYGNRVDTVCRK